MNNDQVLMELASDIQSVDGKIGSFIKSVEQKILILNDKHIQDLQGYKDDISHTVRSFCDSIDHLSQEIQKVSETVESLDNIFLDIASDIQIVQETNAEIKNHNTEGSRELKHQMEALSTRIENIETSIQRFLEAKDLSEDLPEKEEEDG